MGNSPGTMCKRCTRLRTWAFVSLSRLVGATDPLPSCNMPHGILYTTALDGSGCRPWTAKSTSDEVRYIDVTNCYRTCTFDNISPASCCNCRAADRAFSLVMNPVLRAAAHQSCRLRSTDVLQKPRVSQLYPMLR